MERDNIRLLERVRRLLDTYTLEDILNHNEMTEEELLCLLYTEGHIIFPEEPC